MFIKLDKKNRMVLPCDIRDPLNISGRKEENRTVILRLVEINKTDFLIKLEKGSSSQNTKALACSKNISEIQ